MDFRYYLGFVCLNQYFGDRLTSIQSIARSLPDCQLERSRLPDMWFPVDSTCPTSAFIGRETERFAAGYGA